MTRLEALRKMLERGFHVRPFGVSEKKHRENMRRIMDEVLAESEREEALKINEKTLSV